MTSDQGCESLEIRRRAIRVRACRRGLRELDILIGGFVESEIDGLDAVEIADLERLLDAKDQDVLSWMVAGRAPPEHDTPIFGRILAFHRHAGPINV